MHCHRSSAVIGKARVSPLPLLPEPGTQSNQMSIPIRHHFLAEFFQRRWADPLDGRVFRYTRPFRSVVVDKVYPSQTGYEKQLYSVPSRRSQGAPSG
jgi:hypothetical protein